MECNEMCRSDPSVLDLEAWCGWQVDAPCVSDATRRVFHHVYRVIYEAPVTELSSGSRVPPATASRGTGQELVKLWAMSFEVYPSL